MRDLLVVVDSRYKHGEWRLWETKMAHVEAEDDATAVRELCIQMATAGHLAWNGELRVRSGPESAGPRRSAPDSDANRWPELIRVYVDIEPDEQSRKASWDCDDLPPATAAEAFAWLSMSPPRYRLTFRPEVEVTVEN
jgi:hypothetical protein